VVDAGSPKALREIFTYSKELLPLVSAHRGGAGIGYPENCIETFEHTIEHAYSILEIDLRLTKEGSIVLHHDAKLERATNGNGLVQNYTLAELKELRLKDAEGILTAFHMPSLDEAIEWARGKTILILDKKDVSLETCIAKIQEHKAQSFVFIMAYGIDDIKKCYERDPDIMMEVFLGNRERFAQFDQSGVPWDRIVPFISHKPLEDLELIEMIHAKGSSCMAGTSRYLDRELRSLDNPSGEVKNSYQNLLNQGIDILETDLPVQVSQLIYQDTSVPRAKAPYFKLR
jgi:glycerophosphoryl diester phosphodiesterase